LRGELLAIIELKKYLIFNERLNLLNHECLVSRECSMFFSPKCWLVLFLAMVPAHSWAKISFTNEVTAYALMEGYKIPFKIKTEANTSRLIQTVRLTLDADQIPTISLQGPVDSRANYKSEISKVSLCGVNNKRVCLNISSHVALDTLIPVSGQMTFSCFFDIANESGKLSVEKIDITNLQIDPWLNGFATVMGGEQTVESRIREEIEKQLKTGKLDLSGVGLLSDLSAKTTNNNLELSLKLKNRAPALKVFQTMASQKRSGNHIEIDEEHKSNGSLDRRASAK
jgi:hypothetical protein